MKHFFDFHSIKTRLFFYFSGLALLILVLIWGFLFILIRPNYINSKKSGLISLADNVSKIYGTKDFSLKADKLAFENNAEMVIFDIRSQSYVYSTVSLITSRYLEQIPIAINAALESENGRQLIQLNFTDIDAEMYLYGQIIDDEKAVLVLLTSVDPFDSTTLILANQLIGITIIVLLLALFLAMVFAQKLSKPIGKLALMAKDIVNDGYDSSYDIGDFTELKQLSDSLNEAGKELAVIQTLRRELIANTSHDLRTPLTMIKAYAEMVRDISGDFPQKRDEHLDVIISETDRLSRLVGDLLDLSKLESEIYEFDIQTISLKECIDETIKKFKLYTDPLGYNFKTIIEQDYYVMADRFRIMQVLYNLIANAAEHVGDDKVVEIRLKPDKENYCRIEVVDYGAGIAKDDLPYIWERYYRSAESHKRSKIGTGLGLAIVKSILTAHGNEFGVISTLGKGTTFYFTSKIENTVSK